jgi:hypothetical protein
MRLSSLLHATCPAHLIPFGIITVATTNVRTPFILFCSCFFLLPFMFGTYFSFSSPHCLLYSCLFSVSCVELTDVQALRAAVASSYIEGKEMSETGSMSPYLHNFVAGTYRICQLSPVYIYRTIYLHSIPCLYCTLNYT